MLAAVVWRSEDNCRGRPGFGYFADEGKPLMRQSHFGAEISLAALGSVVLGLGGQVGCDILVGWTPDISNGTTLPEDAQAICQTGAEPATRIIALKGTNGVALQIKQATHTSLSAGCVSAKLPFDKKL